MKSLKTHQQRSQTVCAQSPCWHYFFWIFCVTDYSLNTFLVTYLMCLLSAWAGLSSSIFTLSSLEMKSRSSWYLLDMLYENLDCMLFMFLATWRVSLKGIATMISVRSFDMRALTIWSPVLHSARIYLIAKLDQWMAIISQQRLICCNRLVVIVFVANEEQDAHPRLSVHIEDVRDETYVLVTTKRKAVFKRQEWNETMWKSLSCYSIGRKQRSIDSESCQRTRCRTSEQNYLTAAQRSWTRPCQSREVAHEGQLHSTVVFDVHEKVIVLNGTEWQQVVDHRVLPASVCALLCRQ